MNETGEAPIPEEAKQENKVVKGVKDAIHNTWEATKETNREYWEIRKELQERLAWHGGGVYRVYVENMDKITEWVWGKGDRGFGNRVMEIHDKIWSRLKGAWIAASSATLDIVRNAATWPGRLFVPIPKDVYKRVAITNVYGRIVTRAAVVGALGAEMAAVREVKAVGEAVVTAPEVAVIMGKRRVDSILENIKRPKVQEVKPL